MKVSTTILFTAVVYLTLLAGCSTDTYHAHEHTHGHGLTHEAQHKAEEEASVEYIIKNFPTREQTLRVRKCMTARTGFDEFSPLPADYGPHILTPVPGEPDVEMPRGVIRAGFACVFDLGLEDRHIPPWHQHEIIRIMNDS